MEKFVLITGANGGIGKALAQEFARLNYNLVLAGTNKEKLDEIKVELAKSNTITIHTIAKDFTDENSIKELVEEIKELGIDVEILCNNAGFASYGELVEDDVNRNSNMIKVNCNAVMELCHYYGKIMKDKGRGFIMNTASLAGFMPGPLMSVYFATKAFVLSLSQALYQELKPYNVHVMALCPGPVNTNLWKSGNAENTKLLKGVQQNTPERIAKIAVRKLFKKKMIEVPQAKNKFMAVGTRFISRKTALKIAYKLQEKK